MMPGRLRGALAILLCSILCLPAARASERQFLVTVLRSSDPQQVRELLGPQSASGRATRRRDTGHWQVIAGEGRPACVATGGAVPQLHIPWIDLTRHGPVPRVMPGWQDVVQRVCVEVRQIHGGVEVQLDWFTGNTASQETGTPGTGLSTVVRGRAGVWLDAGGTLMQGSAVPGARHYGVVHDDPQRFRILVRVDSID